MYEDEEVKYRKKSQHRPPKKSKHKHNYQPCLLSIPAPSFDKVHGRVNVYKLIKADYCPECGKIGESDYSSYIAGERITEEEILTLPQFEVEDLFITKYVNLEGLK